MKNFTQFIRFLEIDLAIPTDGLLLALKHPDVNPHTLPIILWQYGLVQIYQLDRIFDWLQRSG